MRRFVRFVILGVLLAGGAAGCASESSGGMLLQPGGVINATVTGASPTLEIENAGKGDVVVLLMRDRQEMERVSVGAGRTVTRRAPGGVSAKIENSSSEDAFVRVRGLDGDGFNLSGGNPPAGAGSGR